MIKKLPFLLILFGSITWCLTMIKSGIVYNYGMGFWGPNGHDGIWHIAVANGLSKGTWEIPIFSGESLKNYHIGFALLLSSLHKLTLIPMVNLYFQILPVLISLSVGISAYKFLFSWTKSYQKTLFSLFFIYFGGSFGYLISFFRNGSFDGESMFWTNQAISTLINPPFALSLIIIFSGLFYLMKGLDEDNKNSLIISTFLFGILIQVKAYAGILILGGLFLSGLFKIIKGEGLKLFKVFLGSLLISLFLYAAFSKGFENNLIFKPFWFLETMMESSDRLFWPKFATAMQNYKQGGVFIKLFLAYSIALLIFVLGNFALRIVSTFKIIKLVKKPKNLDYLNLIFILIIFAGIALPTIFIQKGNSWNSIQFLYYSLFFSGIYSGIWLSEFLKKHNKLVGYILIVIIIILTIPTTYATLTYNYLPNRPPARISNEELDALKFLSAQPDGVVLTQPFDEQARREWGDNPPKPIYLYESTAYVSAISDKPVYMEDELNLEITGYNWEKRKENVIKLLSDQDDQEIYNFLVENSISYIYWLKDNKNGGFWNEFNMEKIFENDEVSIITVNNI